ncbi:ketopantoate reductase family protein [Halalkalicoccus salilacus]|uniref:ketopantoate reductase family protein n=1 Tax=Halalkalicoccus TaxID=332246 RepID=UPI002F96C6D4
MVPSTVGGVAYIFSTIGEPDVIEHTGSPERFVIGELDDQHISRIEALDDVLSERDGIDAVLADDIRVELWRKFIFICARAGRTATTRLSIGQIRETDVFWGIYRRIMEEVAACRSSGGYQTTRRYH